MTAFGLRSTSWAALLAFFTSLTACGGGEDAPPPTTLVSTTLVPTTVVPTTAPAPTLPAQPPEQLSKEQLRELVAPVALYPDVVLASLLPATTYPEQVADAAGWLRQQNGQVQAVPDDRNWDGSVAGLLQFPDVLTWLDQNDPWEEQMGAAMTYQQGDVLEAIQDYRRLALDAGNLKSNEYMKVSAQPDQDITIAPAQPDVVYVPQYDTAAVTQPQERTGINPWLAFGGGAVVGALGAWALYSIFDDDDDDHHHGGRKKKVVKQYNNYYYSGSGQRPQPVAWQPRQGDRRRLRRDEAVVRPTPYEPVYTAKPAAQRPGEVKPPKQRGGQQRRDAVAQPTTAPPAGGQQMAPQGGGGRKQGGGGGGGGQKQKQGGGQKQRQQNVEQERAPAPAPTPAPSTREGTKSPQVQQQKKQGGGGGGGGGGGKQGGGKQGDGQNKNKKKKKQSGDAN